MIVSGYLSDIFLIFFVGLSEGFVFWHKKEWGHMDSLIEDPPGNHSVFFFFLGNKRCTEILETTVAI